MMFPDPVPSVIKPSVRIDTPPENAFPVVYPLPQLRRYVSPVVVPMQEGDKLPAPTPPIKGYIRRLPGTCTDYGAFGYIAHGNGQ